MMVLCGRGGAIIARSVGFAFLATCRLAGGVDAVSAAPSTGIAVSIVL